VKLKHCREAGGPTQTDRWCNTLSADIVAVACTAVGRGPADTSTVLRKNLASAIIVKT